MTSRRLWEEEKIHSVIICFYQAKWPPRTKRGEGSEEQKYLDGETLYLCDWQKMLDLTVRFGAGEKITFFFFICHILREKDIPGLNDADVTIDRMPVN